jgi:hypothetical protein
MVGATAMSSSARPRLQAIVRSARVSRPGFYSGDHLAQLCVDRWDRLEMAGLLVVTQLWHVVGAELGRLVQRLRMPA